MIDDVFCKIVKKELGADIVLENNDILAFRDIHPQAPIHIVIIPKKHFESLSETGDKDAELLGKILLAAKDIAEKLDIDKDGYRIIMNKGEHGGQLVPHFHIHLLGGKKLGAKIVQDPK